MKQVIALCMALLVAGCTNQAQVEESSGPSAHGGAPEILKISSDPSSLSPKDIQTLARDALSRFVDTYSNGRVFSLSTINYVDLFADSEDRPGVLDFYLKDGQPYNPGIEEIFGNYDTLPAPVRKVVRNEKERPLGGYPLGIKHIAWSKEQAKVQVCLYWVQTISESFTFLYDVQEDGQLGFVRSQMMGCSSPDGYFIKNTSEQSPADDRLKAAPKE